MGDIQPWQCFVVATMCAYLSITSGGNKDILTLNVPLCIFFTVMGVMGCVIDR